VEEGQVRETGKDIENANWNEKYKKQQVPTETRASKQIE
jgi:hypothetical protein